MQCAVIRTDLCIHGNSIAHRSRAESSVNTAGVQRMEDKVLHDTEKFSKLTSALPKLNLNFCLLSKTISLIKGTAVLGEWLQWQGQIFIF